VGIQRGLTHGIQHIFEKGDDVVVIRFSVPGFRLPVRARFLISAASFFRIWPVPRRPNPPELVRPTRWRTLAGMAHDHAENKRYEAPPNAKRF